MALIKSIAGNEICDQTCRNTVNNTSIGGVNLAKNTLKMSISYTGWNVIPNGGVVTRITPAQPLLNKFQGLKWTCNNNASAGLYLNTLNYFKCPEFKVGETYTISAWASVDVSSAAFSPNSICEGQQLVSYMTNVNTGWTRIYVTFVAKQTSFNSCYYIATTSGYVWLCGVKFERGNKPTDWSPAPYDTFTMHDDGAGNITMSII